MDYTPLYYGYSTIAQTMGSAFALLTAIVLFRMQELYARIGEASGRMVEPGQPEDRVDSWFQTTRIYQRQLDELTAAFAWSLKWTAGTIVACFILIPSTSKDTPFGDACLARLCIWATVASATYCFWTFRPLLKGILPKKEP
jgi:uncharacterized membrane protein